MHARAFTTLILVFAALGPTGCSPAPGGDASPVPAASSGANLRTPWGDPDVSGIWMGANLNAKTHNLAVLEGLYRPEARAAMQKMSEKDDPLLRCQPYGIPRAYLSPPWPFQIVQAPGTTVVLTEYYHAYRVIPTDNRSHAADMFPTYFGDSVGRWEGDTLVVDVTAFNGKIWLADRDKPSPASPGVWPTSDALHIVERWRRVDAGTLEYQAVVEDPKMLAAPWTTPKASLKRAPEGTRLGEAMCLDTTTYSLAAAN